MYGMGNMRWSDIVRMVALIVAAVKPGYGTPLPLDVIASAKTYEKYIKGE